MRKISDTERPSTLTLSEPDTDDFLHVREARLCSGKIRRMSKQPTVPVPPPLAAALRRPPSRDDLAKLAKSKLPRDLIGYVDAPKIVDEPPVRTNSGITASPLRADVLQILDEAWHAEDLALKARGISLHLAVEPSLPLSPALMRQLMRTLLQVAVDGSSGGRLSVSARARRGAELVVSIIDTRYSSSKRAAVARIDRKSELNERLEKCRALVEGLGGGLHLDCDACSTIMRVFVPTAAEQVTTGGALAAG